MIDPVATKNRIRKKLENTEVDKQLKKAFESLLKAQEIDEGVMKASEEYRKAGMDYLQAASNIWNENLIHFESKER
jgi:hypothetical protein